MWDYDYVLFFLRHDAEGSRYSNQEPLVEGHWTPRNWNMAGQVIFVVGDPLNLDIQTKWIHDKQKWPSLRAINTFNHDAKTDRKPLRIRDKWANCNSKDKRRGLPTSTGFMSRHCYVPRAFKYHHIPYVDLFTSLCQSTTCWSTPGGWVRGSGAAKVLSHRGESPFGSQEGCRTAEVTCWHCQL